MKKLSIHAPLIQEAETKELSNLQKDWREYFGAKLAKFGVESPAELDEEKKKEFFNDLKKDWERGQGVKAEAKDELEKDKEKAEDKKAEEPAEDVADLKGSPEEKLKELTKEGEEAINEFGGDFTKEYDGFIILDVPNQKAYKFRYIKGVKGVKAENEAIAKVMKKTGQPRAHFMVHGSIQKGEFDKTDKHPNFGPIKIEVLESVNEAEVKTEAEFKEYAQKVLKKAHPDDFDEDKANKTIDGILKKADGDFGAAVGILTSSLG